MEETREEQERTLATLDWSLLFLVLLILGILISFAATSIQREGVARNLLCGQSEEIPDVFPLRWRTGVLSVGATAFFALLSRRTLKEALEGEDCARQRSARANALASALVLAATLIRLDDLEFVGASRQSAALEETLTPE